MEDVAVLVAPPVPDAELLVVSPPLDDVAELLVGSLLHPPAAAKSAPSAAVTTTIPKRCARMKLPFR